jgi:hypothetical protein
MHLMHFLVVAGLIWTGSVSRKVPNFTRFFSMFFLNENMLKKFDFLILNVTQLIYITVKSKGIAFTPKNAEKLQ